MPATDKLASKFGIYQLFMLGLCVYVLLVMAIEVLFPLDKDTALILNYVDTGICVIFILDFFANIIRAENKLEYLKWGWVDLISSIPNVGWLRVGRFARVIRILRVLRAIRSTKMLVDFMLKRKAQSAFMAALFISLILVVFGSITILHCEKTANANIQNAGDALWWAVVTVTTVGYGDYYPVTAEGRIIAGILMTTGVGLFGTFTGFVASWFVEDDAEKDNAQMTDLKQHVQSLEKKIDQLLQNQGDSNDS